MKAALLSAVACLACWTAMLVVSPQMSFGGTAPSTEAGGAPGSLGGALVTPGSPAQGEQARAAEEAQLSNPGVVAEREASRTKFENLDGEQAAKVAGEAFPRLVTEQAGGPPKVPAGETIASFPTENAAQVELGEGRHAVIESLTPVAIESSPGHRTAINLGLGESGGAFEPAAPLVGVRIPKRLASGVSLPGVGVSLTPVDAHGTALSSSEGTVEGAVVFFANTQTDADTVVKPTTFGFEADTVLRSEASPQQLSYTVGLPQGASLEQPPGAAGSVQVVAEGAVVATVLAPSAEDAAGTTVPVAMSVSGDTLTLSVEDKAGEYEYPIDVDPSVNDEQVTGASKPTRWKFGPTGAPHFTSGGWKGSEALTVESTGTYAEREDGYLYYETQGESKIVEATIESAEKNTGNVETVLDLAHLSGSEDVEEDEKLIAAAGHEYGKSGWHVCDDYYVFHECIGGEAYAKYAAPHNLVKLQQSTTGAGAGENVATLYTANVDIYQENGPEEAKFNTTSSTLYNGHEYVHNVLYNNENKPEDWLSEHNGAFEVKTKDPGIGISHFGISIGGWGERNELFEEGKCEGIQCPPEFNQTFTGSAAMGTGELSAEVSTQDGNKYWSPVAQHKIKVDNAPPYDLAVTGLPSNGVINEAQYHLRAQAIDGKAPTASSGIKSLELGLDGYTLPGKTGSCTPGPCSATGEWTINGEAFGAGKHTLTLVAADYAGNIEKTAYSITARHASPLPVAPGSVDPITGAFRLGASDVSISGGRGSLGVSRGYSSRQLTGGEEGPFGPQWSISVSGSQTVEQESTGSVVLVSAGGERTVFESNGKGGYISPKGDEDLVLLAEKEGETVKAYLLKDPAAGTTVKYTQPGGSGPWVIASSEGALTKTNGEKSTVEWERVENITRPKLALAPAPQGVTCSPTVKTPTELSVGCRALSFTYATETTATGEAPSGWKAYKGRLMQVDFTAYNVATKAMKTRAVAEYAYDKQGRLRAEWDPRIESSPLKTTYGYDSEGHVVSVNPPGQEPWLMHYGTTTSDTSTGRLLSVTRPAAGTASQLKERDENSAPENTALPTLSSTSPVVGATLSVSSNGTWSSTPLAYSYSWEDCYTLAGKQTCTVILGAANSAYTLQPRDAGYTLKAQITGVNSDGATVAATAESGVVESVAPGYLRKFGEKGESESGQFKGPAAVAIDASGDAWVVDHGNNRVEEWNAAGTWMHTYGKKGTGKLQFEGPEGIAINKSTGDVYVADKGNNRVEELNAKGEWTATFGEKGGEPGQLSSPVGVAVAPNGNVWVADYGNDRVDEFTETGGYLGSFGKEGTENGQLKGPTAIAFSGEDAYVVDSGNNRVQEFSMSGQYIEKFGTKGTGNGQFETPYEIATEPVSGDLYVADVGNNRIQEFNPAGKFVVAYGKKGEGTGEFSGPDGLAINSSGYAYVADTGNNRVQELEPKYSTNDPLPEPPALGTSSVTTMGYNVPLSGTGVPAMTKTELEKWGQIDDPAEPVPGEPLATAVFPPAEPMGWPAKDYKAASVTYYDELGRLVNHASPSGGIATSEYNETNEVIRSLSADNREAALKESAKSKEVAELLDTKSRYNGETKEEKEAEEKAKDIEPGARLLEVRGPQHTIKLAAGGEVKARNHVKYYYDEGAPSGETYDLVTKTTDAAEYEGKEAEDRVTNTSYSGQEDLGWLLRKPTSVTTDPSGLKLVRTTFYNPRTGNITETRAPGASGSGEPVGAYQYTSDVTTAAPAPFASTRGVAVDASGHVWVLDRGNDRVDELSATGEYLAGFGTKGTAEGDLDEPLGIAVNAAGDIWVAESETERLQEFSPAGTVLKVITDKSLTAFEPLGVAIDSSGNIWVIDDENGVIEFSSTGTFLRDKLGTLGSPKGIAADSKGDVWVTDAGHDDAVEFSSTATEIGSFSSEGTGNGQLKAPFGVAIAGESAYVVDGGNNRVEQFTLKTAEGKTTGTYAGQFGTSGTGNGDLKEPKGVVLDKEGHIWVADQGNKRLQEFSPRNEKGEYKYLTQVTTANSEPLGSTSGVALNSAGDVWVVDKSDDRVDEYSPTGEYLKGFGAKGTAEGDFDEPEGITIDSEGHIWVADTENNRIEEFSSTGTFTKAFGDPPGVTELRPKGIAIGSSGDIWITDAYNGVVELSSTGEHLRTIEGFGTPLGIAADSKGDIWVPSRKRDAVVELSSTGAEIGSFGSEGTEDGEMKEPAGVVISGENAYVSERGNNRIQEFTLFITEGKTSGEYSAKFGTSGTGNGQLKEPRGIALDKEGHLWVADTGNARVQKFTPNPPGPHAGEAIYYSATPNEAYPACGGHPEWAGLSCQTQPATQPKSGKALPVVTDTYNVWDEPETVTEKFGATTRTKKLTYDSAGRLHTNEETAASDTALPTVTDEYSVESGALLKQSATAGESTNMITSVRNTIGQLTEYIDANGNTTKYVYYGPAYDGQLEEVAYGDEKGAQIYSYSSTTNSLTKILDMGPEGGPGAGTFTASHDVEGNITSDTYPDGMTATYASNATGETTGITYEKTAHCAGSCPEVWFKEIVAPSVHGEILSRTSTLAKEEYTYDNTGRLSEVDEVPDGKGCKTRIYGYNGDSERTSETTRESATETCVTSGGATEKHTYDEADRLSDSGVEYENFGNATKMPAADAGEHEITASFYVDGQVATQTQNGETTSYSYDPAGRTEKTISEGTTKATVVNQYPGPGEAISWTEEEDKQSTRNIPGIDGALVATQHNSEPAVLQLHDLSGNIIATAAVSETETKLLTTYNPTEFGVPVNGTPPTKFSWLGATGLATEQASGAANPGGGSYVPQLGRPLQTEPVEAPGAYANGSYGGAAYVTGVSGQSETLGADLAAGAPEREAARLAAARKFAEEEEARALAEAELEATLNAPAPGEGGAEELVDPVKNLVLFTPAEAIEYGEVLCNCSLVHGMSVAIEEIARKIGLTGVGEVFEEILTGGIAESLGKTLLFCGRTLASNSANRCALEYHSYVWLIPTLEPFSIGFCYYHKKSKNGEKRGLHCEDGQYYKPGSY
jgi:DNA-binding beta-propeller fold protein YncE